MVTVNGAPRDGAAGGTLAQLLLAEGYDEGRVAVELGGEIVPRELYGATLLADGDRVEILRFVGGG